MTDQAQATELAEFVRWLVEYAAKPIDPELIRQAERRDLSVETLLSLGHGAALTAVTGKVQEILRGRTNRVIAGRGSLGELLFP